MRNDGNCYEMAVHHGVFDLDRGREYVICHGTVGGKEIRGEFIEPHGHAWLEYTEDFPLPSGNSIECCFVVDKSNGNDVLLPADLYYSMGNVQDVIKYTRKEAMEKIMETGVYGPWEEEEECKHENVKVEEDYDCHEGIRQRWNVCQDCGEVV